MDMGRATFVSTEIPVAGPRREVVRERLEVDGRRLSVTCVSVGNPHCVVFTDALDVDEVKRLGPKIERHPSFPNRINVQFAKVLGRDRVSILIWERGAGYTLASGTSSCAVAAACVKNGVTDRRVTIVKPRGRAHRQRGRDLGPDAHGSGLGDRAWDIEPGPTAESAGVNPGEGRRHLRRSFLFVPGSEEKKLAKAPSLGADAVILDLEDAVTPARKAEARTRIRTLLQAQDGIGPSSGSSG